ncbi:histidine-type phosphatase [Mycolicibacterium aichiense]|uniref:Phosphoanhydride phosphohydrolase n=1 Tax=Mycolicibacterium aichiense TaxID=1799 RepID=A0AAD1MAE8_9MYCO|nr:histidine-type phosphatase [Mycolicibacterium aichiense]MCV7020995.1 histidine-type phosphatase [Mycolicibacterium aichiense]BBX05566.1 phosphoanhydride phosphohydrolase [Mycolicibacterium aichiense]
MLRLIALAVTLCILGGALPSASRADTWRVVRTVMLMRHGVRPPNKEPPVPVSIAPDPWPAWSTRPGWLTDHGAAAVRLVAAADARRFIADGTLPAHACPPPGSVRVVSDSLQRTIATGDAYASSLAPGCGIVNHHAPQGEADPLFDAYRTSDITTAAAQEAVASAVGPGGVTALAQQYQSALDAVTHIVCGNRPDRCGLADVQSGTEVDPSGAHRPRLTGALAYGSVISEVLELEYAEGKPRADVGWGRATADDIRLVGGLHALELSIIARPRPLAVANAGKIADVIRDAVDTGPPLTVIVGHDTEVANIAGLLDAHWSVTGFADDEPAPGGALVFQLLEAPNGDQTVRAWYRSQTLEQIRALTDGDSTWVPLAIRGCPGELCSLDSFVTALTA